MAKKILKILEFQRMYIVRLFFLHFILFCFVILLYEVLGIEFRASYLLGTPQFLFFSLFFSCGLTLLSRPGLDCNPPPSASQVAEIRGVCHQSQSYSCILIQNSFQQASQ
jgi:hypothetical protein